MWYISAYYGEYKDNLSFANLTYYDRKTKKEAMADFEKLRVEPVR